MELSEADADAAGIGLHASALEDFQCLFQLRDARRDVAGVQVAFAGAFQGECLLVGLIPLANQVADMTARHHAEPGDLRPTTPQPGGQPTSGSADERTLTRWPISLLRVARVGSG